MTNDPNYKPLVTVFGGSGFVGTQVVQELARKGYRIRVAVRRPDLAGHLRPLGAVGQVVPLQANVRNLDSVRRAVDGADVVINLVAIRSPWGKQTFDAVHAEGASHIANAARDARVKRMVHVSALGTDANSKSRYASSKAAGEAAVLAAFPDAVILRPSVIFGKGDGFFNMLGGFSRAFPIIPLIGGASRFQPIYVGDVATAVVGAAEGLVKGGRVYELGGPEIETYKELNQRVLREVNRTNPLLPLPAGIAKLLALPMKLLPNPLLTADQVDLLGQDNVVSEAAIKDKRTLAAFGITPTNMGAVLPGYLWRFRKNGQFEKKANPADTAA